MEHIYALFDRRCWTQTALQAAETAPLGETVSVDWRHLTKGLLAASGKSPDVSETIARIPGSFHPARVSCKAFRVWSRPSPWASRHISSAMRALICSWVRTL